ncbi:hypothetical protein NDU88_000847 [Pleurodeles waltl]|uniref:Uncharacterized protein n=1 Tax=Pleurodeles waltl TaxID=8319 RepID=A0AAV7VYQ1_PLEWA|nr:hypothetical protein NDU88_000847 [Pleurodeles waltl]
MLSSSCTCRNRLFRQMPVCHNTPVGFTLRGSPPCRQGKLCNNPRQGYASEQLRVWMVGHSYITGAQRWAAAQRDYGRPGMQCVQMIPAIECSLQREEKPDAMVTHPRGNDVACMRRKDLLAALVLRHTAVARLLHPADVL